MLSILKLSILGILWCSGGATDKAQELYLTMTRGQHDHISANTKLFD